MEYFIVHYCVPCLSAFVASIGFSFFYNIRNSNIIFASLGGLLGWIVYLICFDIFSKEPSSYLIAAAVVTLYSEILAKLRNVPATVFLFVSLIPLVPGKAIFRTMESVFEADRLSFVMNALSTFKTALFLALGVLLVAFLTKAFAVIVLKRKNAEYL